MQAILSLKVNMNELTFNYAPILVVVYDRLWHFSQCIESLKSCPEAPESILYIASDAAYRKEDEEKILNVRNYIKLITGFKEVVPIIRESNVGALVNINEARNQIYQNHDTIITMEDDVIVGKGFLHFMNQGLHIYRDNPKVIGIAGYLPPGIESEDGQPFFLNRFAPYGSATWREKNKIVETYRTPEFYDKCFKDYSFFKEYERISPHVVRAIPLLIHGGRRFGDIERGLIMQRNGFLALYPPTSITKNIGNDGTGLHSGVNTHLQNQIVSNEFYNLIGHRQPVGYVDEKMNFKLAEYRRVCCVRTLNYFLYFLHKYIPGYFKSFFFIRNVVKKLRSRLIKF
jgi:hypothetical protein